MSYEEPIMLKVEGSIELEKIYQNIMSSIVSNIYLEFKNE